MIVPQQNISVFGELTVSTETDPMVRFQMNSDPMRSTKSRKGSACISDPQKTGYKNQPMSCLMSLWQRWSSNICTSLASFLRICVINQADKNHRKDHRADKIAQIHRHGNGVSPVSPSVVANILMIQNISVISGTFANYSACIEFIGLYVHHDFSLLCYESKAIFCKSKEYT